jgi:hypothetical protein
MILLCRHACALLTIGAGIAFASSAAFAAEFIPNPGFTPKPDTYLCPDATGGAVDCYLQAISHLYTMVPQRQEH